MAGAATTTTTATATSTGASGAESSFQRLRHTLRTAATRTSTSTKRVAEEKEKQTALRRVTFRKESTTDYSTPLLRQASISSPALHLPTAVSPYRSPHRADGIQHTTRHRSTKSYTPGIPPSHRSETPAPHHRSKGPSTASASTSHLPVDGHRSPAPSSPRKPGLEPRRVSTSASPSATSITRPSFDPSTRRTASPSLSPASGPVHGTTRPMSPLQRSYASNRHFNISSGSLVLNSPHPQSNPEHRQLIRSATSLLCREMVRPTRTLSPKEKDDWEEIDIRMHQLVRSERVRTSTSTGGNEDRERKLFGESLRDGYVLCQLLNKLSPRPLLRPDPRESILLASSSPPSSPTTSQSSPSPPTSPSKSNLTKFLAACHSLGLSEEDLFAREDLLFLDANEGGLIRVAKTVLKLVEAVKGEGEEGIRGRGIIIRGMGESVQTRTPTPTSTSMARTRTAPLPTTPSPKTKERQRQTERAVYGHGQTSAPRAAAASTPNLLSRERTLRSTGGSPESGGGRAMKTSRSREKERERPLPQTPTPIRIKSRTEEREAGEDEDMRGYSPFQDRAKSKSKPIVYRSVAAALALNSDEDEADEEEEEEEDLSVYRSEPASPPRISNRTAITPPMPLVLKRPPKSPLRKASGQLGSKGEGGRVKERERERDREKEKGGGLLSWARNAARPVSKAAAGVIGLSAGAGAVDGPRLRLGSGQGQEVECMLIENRMESSSTGVLSSIPASVADTSGVGVVGKDDPPRWSLADSTRASVGDNGSVRDSIGELGLGLPSNYLWGRRGGAHTPSPTHPNAQADAPTQAQVQTHAHGLAHAASRQSVQSKKSMQSVGSEGTTTTVITAVSSLLDAGRGYGYGNGYGWGRRASGKKASGNASANGSGGQFGTIRTMTTDLTSDPPSLGRTEGSWVVEEMKVQVQTGGSPPLSGMGLGRKRSSSIVDNMRGAGGKMDAIGSGGLSVLDLTRVAEEEDKEGGADEDGNGSEDDGKEEKEKEGGLRSMRPLELPLRSREREWRGRKMSISPPSPGMHDDDERSGRGCEREKPLPTAPAIATEGGTALHLNLKKGKWPDDFLDVFGPTKPSASAVDLGLGEERERSERGRSRGGEEDVPMSAPPLPLPTSAPVTNTSTSAGQMSISSPRKRAIVGLGSRWGEESGGGLSANPGSTSTPSVAVQAPSFPRRPTTHIQHRSRHSIDAPIITTSITNNAAGANASTPVLLPKEAVWGRETSPDGNGSGSGSGGSGGNANGNGGRIMLRRQSTKPSAPGLGVRVPRNGSGNYSPRIKNQVLEDSPVSAASAGGSGSGSGLDSSIQGDLGSAVPFPRTVSGEHPYPHGQGQQARGRSPLNISSDAGLAGEGASGGGAGERPRIVRGRFQSDVDGTSAAARRRATARPNSLDELGAVVVGGVGAVAGVGIAEGGGGVSGVGGLRLRSRFESMVNLGVSDPLGGSRERERDSMDGGGNSQHRQRLVVREDGKPPTHFQLGNCIGRGQFGSVYRALNLNTGQMVAVKRIRLEGLKEEEVTQLMREVDLVKSLSHPSIVKYEGVLRDEDTLNIILEYAENGSLGQTLKAFGKLNEPLVARYVVKILEGLHYLHTSDVVHCDLKAANILTTKNGNVKLTDFGVSLNLRAMEREIDKDVTGTPNWMAPEVIELKGASTKSDIWSLGCTVVELLTGRPPYADIANSMTVMFRIVEDPMPPLPDGCDALLKDFLMQCFNKNPTLRPSAEKLCEHPWLKKNWSAFKDLGGQDSIPFIRRVSTDFQKNDAIRYLSQLEIPDTPLSGSPKDVGLITPMGRRTSAASSVRPPEAEFSPREHTFVKTTFSKPMICRVCLSNVKKTAVLCSQCSLISHSKCAPNAPPTCDLRAQLLLYAQYAERGNPASAYSNPAGTETHQNVALSDVAFVEHTSRTSLDGSQPPRTVEHPPTAFKFMAAFKRSRTTPPTEPGGVAASPSSAVSKDSDDKPTKRRQSAPATAPKRPERPLSMTSTSTGPSSLRSAATANESFSSRQNTGRRSQLSGSERSRIVSSGAVLETVPGSRPTTSGHEGVGYEDGHDEDDEDDEDTQPPGIFDPGPKKKKKGSPGNCMVQ